MSKRRNVIIHELEYASDGFLARRHYKHTSWVGESFQNYSHGCLEGWNWRTLFRSLQYCWLRLNHIIRFWSMLVTWIAQGLHGCFNQYNCQVLDVTVNHSLQLDTYSDLKSFWFLGSKEYNSFLKYTSWVLRKNIVRPSLFFIPFMLFLSIISCGWEFLSAVHHCLWSNCKDKGKHCFEW